MFFGRHRLPEEVTTIVIHSNEIGCFVLWRAAEDALIRADVEIAGSVARIGFVFHLCAVVRLPNWRISAPPNANPLQALLRPAQHNPIYERP